MARLFVSYNRTEADYAFAVRQWLMAEQGWASEDIFVDASHLYAGVEWEPKLLAEAERAQVMLFLASDNSLHPKSFCRRELNQAKGQIIVVTIKGVLWDDERLEEAIPSRARSRQITTLDQEPTTPFPFVWSKDNRNDSVQLNPDRVAGIGQTLRDLGVAPNSFTWTPVDAGPFPGLPPLMEGDEAIFCGRDLEIRDGLKAIEDLRATLTHRALIIQAPSGAGKSSFLRAGLWRRLRWNPTFTPLAIIRSQKGAVRHEEWGLVTGLSDTLTKRNPELGKKLPLSRDDLATRAAADLPGLLAAFADADAGEAGRHTLLLGIDQAEEMTSLSREDDAELDRLLQVLLHLPEALDLRLILTARDDSVDAILDRLTRAGLPQDQVDTWRLHRLPPIRFHEIINGPAAAADRAGWKLTIDPALVAALVAAAGAGASGEGGDALPILALALQRLVAKHRAPDGRITLAAAGAAKFLEDAVEDATADALKAAQASVDDLRRLVIPRLATWDPDAGAEGAAKRQVANAVDLFAGDRASLMALAAALVEQRLLTVSRGDPVVRGVVLDAQSDAAYEVAHEALLRVKLLGEMILACRGKFEQVRILKSESQEWEEEKEARKKEERLARSGQRLSEALELLKDPDFGPGLAADGSGVGDYLAACQTKERAQIDKQRRLIGRAFVKPARQALDSGLNDHALRLAAAGTVLAEDVDWKLVPELRHPALEAICRNRAVARLEGHTDLVKSASFSPDGARIVTASADKTARVWDAQSGALVASLEGHTRPVMSASFSPDGARIVTASADKTARIWDARSGALVASLEGHTECVYFASFSPDGARIVTASGEWTRGMRGVAWVWDAQSGALVARLAGHTKVLRSAAFSPDGARIVTASDDKTARVWDAQSGALVASLKGHTDCVWSTSFSPDGGRIVTASVDNTARVWDAQSGALVARLKGHQGRVRSASFSPDGARIVTASEDKTARVWNAQSGALVASLEGHTDCVWSTSFSPDGGRIVTASVDNTARVWDAQSGAVSASLKGHTDWVLSASFSPDGGRIVTASVDNTARVWDAQSGAVSASLKGRAWPWRQAARRTLESLRESLENMPDEDFLLVRFLNLEELLHRFLGTGLAYATFSADGIHIVTASGDKMARVWDMHEGALTARLKGHKKELTTASFSPDGGRIVTASEDKTARVWNAQSGALVASLEGHTDWVLSASFSPDGAHIVTASEDSTARVWDAQSGALVAGLKGHQGTVRSAAFSPDGARIVTASSDKTARVWDAQSGALVASLEGHTRPVMSASFSPDGAHIVTASEDKTARVWNAQSGALVASLEGHTRPVMSASFSPDGARIVTASGEWNRGMRGVARVWDAQSGALVASLEGHTKSVRSAAFSPDGARIVTASDDNTARVWDAQSGALVASLEGHQGSVCSASFSPDGARIVTASSDNTARVWDAARSAVIVRDDALSLAAALACGLGRRTEAEAKDILMQDAPENLFETLKVKLGPERAAQVTDVAAALRAPMHANCYLSPTQFAEMFGLSLPKANREKPENDDQSHAPRPKALPLSLLLLALVALISAVATVTALVATGHLDVEAIGQQLRDFFVQSFKLKLSS